MTGKKSNVVEIAPNHNDTDTDSNGNEEAFVKDVDDAKPVSLCQLFEFADFIDKLLMFGGAFGGIAAGTAMPMFSIIFGDLTDDFNIPGSKKEAGKKYAILFLYLAVGMAFASFLQVACFTISSERMCLRIRKNYLKSLLKQDIAFFDASSGSLSSRIAENTVLIRDGTAEKLGQIFQFITMFIVGFGVGFYFSWQLTLVILAICPLLALCGYLMMSVMGEAVKGTLGSYEKAGEIAEEAIGKFQTVVTFGLQKRLADKYEKALIIGEKMGIKKAKTMGLGMGSTMGIYFASYGLAFWYGANLVIWSKEDATEAYPPSYDPNFPLCKQNATLSPLEAARYLCGDVDSDFTFSSNVDVCNCISCNCGCTISQNCLTGGDVVLAFFSVIIGGFSIGQAAPGISALGQARVAMGKVRAIINRTPEIDESSGKGAIPTDINGQIEFKDIKFRYPTRPDTLIFKNLNLSIKPNTSIALVGGTGCGKSTVTQLLQRFYDPEDGGIFFDGLNIKDINISWLRSQIGTVGQEPVLFAASIFDNICFGLTKTARDQMDESQLNEAVENAARAANAFNFISNFTDGFQTYVGEKGGTMSGGQKQRIAIARALIRNPSILILDEATSALDNESEKIVQKALDELVENGSRTTLVIAHRLTTVRNCDKIFVLGDGGVLESGNHSSLKDKSGGHYNALLTAAKSASSSNDKKRESSKSKIMKNPKDLDIKKGVSVMIEDDFNDENKDGLDTKDEKIISSCCGFLKKKSSSKNEKKKEDIYKVPFRRVFEFSKGDSHLYIYGVFAAMVNGAQLPIFAILFSGILTTFFLPTTEMIMDEAERYALYFLIFAVIGAITNYLAFYCFGTISEKMTTRVRSTVFATLLKQDAGFYDTEENSVGAVTARLATDAALVKASCSDRLNLIVMNTSTIIVGLTIAFYYGWKLTLVLFATIPLLCLAGAAEAANMTGVAHEDAKALEKSGSVLTESISGIRTVRAFAMRDRIVSLYKSFLLPVQKLAIKKGLSAGFGYGFGQGCMFLVYAVAFYYGAVLIDDPNESYTFKDVMLVIFAIVMMGFGVGQAFAMAPDVAKAKGAISSVFKLIDRKSKIDPFAKGEIVDFSNNSKTPCFEFKDVSFTYPSRPDSKVFTKLDLKIKKGSTVALVGMSGSGKSSTIKMIERFYDVDHGELLCNGTNIKKLDQKSYRDNMALVSQEPHLFSTTVYENIAFGLPDDDIIENKQRVEEAAKAAGAHDFISELPQGYQTSVSTSSLSGGQKQRIAIARAIVREPQVLLLDEATSALDNETEMLVQKSLSKLIKQKNKTCIIVGHRLSAIKDADIIHVVHQGVIVESGTHSQLMGEDGAYSKLYASQA